MGARDRAAQSGTKHPAACVASGVRCSLDRLIETFGKEPECFELSQNMNGKSAGARPEAVDRLRRRGRQEIVAMVAMLHRSGL